MLLRLTMQVQAESFPVTILDDFGIHCLYNEKLMLKNKIFQYCCKTSIQVCDVCCPVTRLVQFLTTDVSTLSMFVCVCVSQLLRHAIGLVQAQFHGREPKVANSKPEPFSFVPLVSHNIPFTECAHLLLISKLCIQYIRNSLYLLQVCIFFRLCGNAPHIW